MKKEFAFPGFSSLSTALTYPLLMTSVRLSVFNQLKKDKRFISALFSNLYQQYSRYGVFALYRGIDTYLIQQAIRTQINATMEKIKGPSKYAIKYSLIFFAYPLTFAWTRILTYTPEDSKHYSLVDAIQDTVEGAAGAAGLFAGSFPFILASAYEDCNDFFMYLLRSKYPSLDLTDETVLKLCLTAQAAVITTPLLALSTYLRVNDTDNMSQILLEIFPGLVSWKSFSIQVGVVAALFGLNLALIHEKHNDGSEEESCYD